MNTEEWRPIPDFPAYQVSSQGRVRSSLSNQMESGEWRVLKTAMGSHGYLHVGGSDQKRRITKLVSRLVLSAFVGPCPEGKQCRHLDGNRLNNRIENLAWGTRLENASDKFLHGTCQRPRPRVSARKNPIKSNPDLISRIKVMRSLGFQYAEIARQTGISTSFACCLAIGKPSRPRKLDQASSPTVAHT